jgi:hypothetical protein
MATGYVFLWFVVKILGVPGAFLGGAARGPRLLVGGHLTHKVYQGAAAVHLKHPAMEHNLRQAWAFC